MYNRVVCGAIAKESHVDSAHVAPFTIVVGIQGHSPGCC